MTRNVKRPVEPLIGTAGRVGKIGFSTRVPGETNDSMRALVTVINLFRCPVAQLPGQNRSGPVSPRFDATCRKHGEKLAK